ncbi:hypothetical protein SY85_19990 [Flavisolibacter tropicus]|uniref:Sortilin N-terminal domain-containing protein n=2 Tax=Flavisolibacter tropicus TaxID=1492898 RepID=A0A172TZ97_9BACT|nr:hypothetical protein SY85_19990 [Flavisolibacter tropicus]
MLSRKDANLFKVQDAFNKAAQSLRVDPSKVKGYKQFRRWERFWKSRVDANGNLPDINKQVQVARAYRSVSSKAKMLTESDWQLVGPATSDGGSGGIGRILTLGFHPADADVFYVGTAAGGVWKTVDAGKRYVPLMDAIGPFSASSIAVSKSNPSLVLAGGSGPDNLYKSTDGGQTWQPVKGLPAVTSIFIHPSNPDIIVVSTYKGIYRSVNQGISFSVVLNVEVTKIIQKPDNPNTLYTCRTDGSTGTLEFYRSLDAGVSWVKTQSIANGGSNPKMAVAKASPDLVEVATVNGSALKGIYRSLDAGQSYTQYFIATNTTNFLSYSFTPNDNGGMGSFAFAFTVNPNNPAHKYIGSVNTWRTLDNGSNWSLANRWCCSVKENTVHADKHFLGFSPVVPNRLYETNDGGIYVTEDGNNWTDITNTMAISQVYHVSPPPPTHKNVLSTYFLLGLQDNGSKKNLQPSNLWSDVEGGDGFMSAIDYGDPNTFYTSLQGGIINRRSTTVGDAAISAKIPGRPATIFDTRFCINPRNSKSLIACYNDLYRTYDQGNSWQKITNNLFFGLEVEKVEIATADTNVNVAMHSGINLMRSTDGGLTWKGLVNNIGGWIGAQGLVDVAIHPRDANKMYVILKQAVAGKAVWKTTDGGSTWSNITSNLPLLNYTSIAVVDGTDDDLYLAADFGVFYRNNSMSQWESFSQGLPVTFLNELKVNYTKNELLVATYGRGLWKTPLKVIPNEYKSGSVQLLNGASFAPGAEVQVKFKFNRLYFNYDNQFALEISDAAGDFSKSTVIGTIASFNNEGFFKVSLPANIGCGSSFRMRVVASAVRIQQARRVVLP